MGFDLKEAWVLDGFLGKLLYAYFLLDFKDRESIPPPFPKK